MHALLRRQLERLRASVQEPPSAETWTAFLDEVSRTYAETDQGESLAVLHAIHEAAPDGILVAGPDRRVLNYNRRFATIWGIPDGLLAARDDDDLLAYVLPQLADPDEFIRRVLYLYDHPGESSREEVHLRDGRVLDRYSAPVPSDRGSCGRVWFFREITPQRQAEEALRLLNGQLEQRVAERTRALAEANAELDENLRKLRDTQDQLLHAGRMAAVGTLAAGVAHEINNPLTFVLNNLGFIREQLDALCRSQRVQPAVSRELSQALADVIDGAERVRIIVRDLRIMSRPQPEQRGPVDVNGALETAVGFAGNELRHHARVVWSLQPVPPVSANEARLGQVFLNLVVNAAQALREEDGPRNEVRIATALEGNQVVVSVADNGVGIPAEHLPRLFDPFFTTKPAGKGTGLGLSICHAIVSGLGGRIAVASTVGLGSVFRIFLPAAANDVPELATGGDTDASAGARARILVLDDEEQVATSIRRVLCDEHEVVCARDVREALALLDGPCVFDLVLCDLLMPGITGMKEFYSEVERKHPDMTDRIVFMSGSSTPAGDAFLARTGNRCLEKPCDPGSLRAVVSEMMSRHAPARQRAAG
jgi:signal transduction histidine kinase/CheY-like chemotaxis protein